MLMHEQPTQDLLGSLLISQEPPKTQQSQQQLPLSSPGAQPKRDSRCQLSPF